jgi:hypothetical protein
MTQPYFINPSNEDDLKILKVEYLSNRLLDHTQILNSDQSKVFKYFKWRRLSKEDDLNILKVEYLSNHLLDPTQILNLSLDDNTMLYKFFKWWRPPIVDDLKILKGEYISNHCMDHDLQVFRREIIVRLRGNLECGSAQPSLYLKHINLIYNVQY